MPDDNNPQLATGITSDATLVVGTKTTRIYHFLNYALLIIEIFLAFRFVLKLLAANPSNVFAEFVYGITFVLMLPFNGIFPHKVTPGPVHMEFDPSIIFAMVVYAVIIWSVSKYVVIRTSKSSKSAK